MAISVISQGAAASATLTLGTFAAGDLIVAFAFRDGSTTAPSLPAGFTAIDNLGANSCSSRAAYRIAVAGDTTFVFTNATEVQWLVLRGHDALSPIGNFARSGAADNQPTYAADTLLYGNGSGWVIGFAGHRDATDMSTPTCAGMTKRAPSVNTLACHTAENVSSFAGVSFGATVNASTGWRGIAIEVIAGRTQMFPTNAAAADGGRGRNDAKLAGGASDWFAKDLTTARGSGVTNLAQGSVTGPTAGIEVTNVGVPVEWVSPPLDADITIALPITMNMRMSRSSASANMGPQVVVERLDSQGAVQETVLNSEQGVENASAETAQNWSGTPTSTVFHRGDRIRVRVAYNDAGGTAATGFTETFFFNGTAAGASGDSYLIFGETLTFVSEPAGTTVYPTTGAASGSINPGAANEYEAWTARGAGVANSVTNTVNGYTAPIQATETAGGTALEWYTKPLTAFTLGGAVRVNLRAKYSAGAAQATARVEIAIVDNDGTNAVVWGAANAPNLTTSEAARSFLVAGDDTAVADGKRLRIRVLLDDGSSTASGWTAMVSGQTVTAYYAGTSGGASGDTFLTFTQTLAMLTQAAAGSASGSGTAYDATTTSVSSGTNAPAGLASGTGAASNASASVAPTAGTDAATGAAAGATASLAPTAGSSAGAGTAAGAATSIAGTSGAAAGAGAAGGAAGSIQASAEAGSGTGAGSGATTAVAGSAQDAAATGAAGGPGAAVAAASGAASATTSAGDLTPSIGASAEASLATGAANGPAAALAGSSEVATGTGASGGPTASVAPTAGLGAVTGEAEDATVDAVSPTGTDVDAELAAATGDAFALSVVLAPGAQAALPAGAATNGAGAIEAGIAAATGTAAAQGAAGGVGASSGSGAATAAGAGAMANLATTATGAAGSAAANAPSPALAVAPSIAAATGAADDATISSVTVTQASAAPAAGQVAGGAPSIDVASRIGAASGTVAGNQPGVGIQGPAGTATGNGAAGASSSSIAPKPTAAGVLAIGIGARLSVKVAGGAAAGSGAAEDAAIETARFTNVDAIAAATLALAFQPSLAIEASAIAAIGVVLAHRARKLTGKAGRITADPRPTGTLETDPRPRASMASIRPSGTITVRATPVATIRAIHPTGTAERIE